jgi:L,D-transpeptidase ErfK/SrfK
MHNKIISIIATVLSLFLMIPTEALAVTRYGEILCQQQGYACYKVKPGETWSNLFPNDAQRVLVMRINRMNTGIYSGMTIALPANMNNLNYMDYAPFYSQISPTGNRLIIVDPSTLAWGAYNEYGNLVGWGPVSMGKSWCPDLKSGCRSPSGKFTVYEERGAKCMSSKFPIPTGGAPMPYCMFFKGGYALHASEVPGYHASHGCVRLFYEDAQWLNKEFVSPGTTVIVRRYPT